MALVLRCLRSRTTAGRGTSSVRRTPTCEAAPFALKPLNHLAAVQFELGAWLRPRAIRAEGADLRFYGECDYMNLINTCNRAPGAIRTRDTGFRRAVLYPLSYRRLHHSLRADAS